MVLLVFSLGNRNETNFLGISSTHPCIIWRYEELFSINLRYVYTKVAFDVGELEGGVL